jgi:hypothetical protein
MIAEAEAAWFVVLVAAFAPVLAALASPRRSARRATLPVGLDEPRRRS